MGYLQERFDAMMSDEGKVFVKHGIYAHMYEELLASYRDKEVVLVEIGTGRGGSLQVWKSYLGSKAMIYGVDHKDGLFYEEDRIKHFMADQFDIASLEAVPVPQIDIFIDDASHNSRGQINTIEVFFPRLRCGGVYIIEDVGTSYRVSEYDGGYRKPGSIIEYCKNIVEQLYINEWVELIPQKEYCKKMVAHLIPFNPIYNNTVESVTFYNGLIVIRKKRKE